MRTTSVEVPATDRDASTRARLVISTLPSDKPSSCSLVDDRNNEEAEPGIPPIQLLESHEYLYEWMLEGVPPEKLTTDPGEIFQPDSADGRRGRLRPGLATGLLRVVLRSGTESLGELELEVRSGKLAYRSEYRWMLRDIAERMTELVMKRFASSAADFEQDSSRDAVTLYQRFEFLRALLADESIDAALREIRRRPHVSWEIEDELVHAAKAMRGSAQLIRNMSRPGNRLSWPGGPVQTIPAQMQLSRTEATHDTTANRFVKFALQRWRQVVVDIQAALIDSRDPYAAERGKRETSLVLDALDAVLHDELFKEVGQLNHFPAENQVLHRREGYRDIFRAYVDFELAAKLSWRREDNAYRAGQRDVAQLYEYWAFIQLAFIVSDIAGVHFDLSPILDAAPDGMSVGLRNGKQTVVEGIVERHGRKLVLELAYNKTFRPGLESWTKSMRPDYSICIKPLNGEDARFEPVNLHFDAKYRVQVIQELFGGDSALECDGEELLAIGAQRRTAKRDDLLKMHAYRDAIRRSAGAYVIFPGGDETGSQLTYPEYHELLPGLGAFVLRPSEMGDAGGTSTLRRFLDDAIDHLAKRFSRHERGRYWVEEAYSPYGVIRRSLFPVGIPRDETTVLLGFVKSAAHWEWIRERKTYNVRAEGREGGVALNAGLLYSQLILLYGPSLDRIAMARIVSGPELIDLGAMKATGYPSPSSNYLCVQLSDVGHDAAVHEVSSESVERFVTAATGRRGQPMSVTWGQLRTQFGLKYAQE